MGSSLRQRLRRSPPDVVYTPIDVTSSPTSPGINYTPISLAPKDFREVENALSIARQDADLVIFSIHWGPNMRARPTGAFREFARRVVSAGADLFWGHSAHLVQGIEFHNGKLILYDTGDLVDDYVVDEVKRNDLSALFLVRVTPPAIESLHLLPVQIGEMQVNMAQGAGREWFVQRMIDLCEEMGTRVATAPKECSIRVLSQ